MAIKQSNPYLSHLSAAQQRAALRVSVESSSAVEGIRAPFAPGKEQNVPATRPNSSRSGGHAPPRRGDDSLEHTSQRPVVPTERGMNAADVSIAASPQHGAEIEGW